MVDQVAGRGEAESDVDVDGGEPGAGAGAVAGTVCDEGLGAGDVAGGAVEAGLVDYGGDGCCRAGRGVISEVEGESGGKGFVQDIPGDGCTSAV